MQEKGSLGQDEHSSEEQQKSLKTVVNRPQTRRIRTFVAYDTLAAGQQSVKMPSVKVSGAGF